jgi:hypothetical protein
MQQPSEAKTVQWLRKSPGVPAVQQNVDPEQIAAEEGCGWDHMKEERRQLQNEEDDVEENLVESCTQVLRATDWLGRENLNSWLCYQVMNSTCIHMRAGGPNICMYMKGKIYKEPPKEYNNGKG